MLGALKYKCLNLFLMSNRITQVELFPLAPNIGKPLLSAGVLRVLVACEESQAVTKEFRKLGHEAYSCDLLPQSGGYPQWHLQKDVFEVLKESWDIIIAFPPCTYLSSAQMGWYNVGKYGQKAINRAVYREEAVSFFMALWNANCERIAIENPVGIMSSRFRKPNQIVQPYHFGDEAQKTTCLWLKGLPNLEYTNVVGKGEMVQNKRKNGKIEYRPSWFKQGEVWNLTPEERRTLRSKTFKGIARAMALQWSLYACT
jgi:site-specific DNA-cytosine methylase